MFCWMYWDCLFEDFEGQFVLEWEVECVVFDVEFEWLCIVWLELCFCLCVFCVVEVDVMIELCNGCWLLVIFCMFGVDWVVVLFCSFGDGYFEQFFVLFLFYVIVGIVMDYGLFLVSFEVVELMDCILWEWMMFGFVLCDFVCCCIFVYFSIFFVDVYGMIDCVVFDYFDIVVYDFDELCRVGVVCGFCMIFFVLVVVVQVLSDQML